MSASEVVVVVEMAVMRSLDCRHGMEKGRKGGRGGEVESRQE